MPRLKMRSAQWRKNTIRTNCNIWRKPTEKEGKKNSRKCRKPMTRSERNGGFKARYNEYRKNLGFPDWGHRHNWDQKLGHTDCWSWLSHFLSCQNPLPCQMDHWLLRSRKECF